VLMATTLVLWAVAFLFALRAARARAGTPADLLEEPAS
jgi:hypothetical protein